MRVYKSVILFWALYFPISFNLKLNIKFTINVCLLTFIIVIALFLPQPIIENAKYINYGIYYGTPGNVSVIKSYVKFVNFSVYGRYIHWV